MELAAGMSMVHADPSARWYGFPASSGAEFSADRLHRFLLWRIWRPEPEKLLGFIMLNPSSADETRDDPTTVRNCERARRLGYAGVVQANLYSFRTPSPAKLKAEGYPGSARLCANRDAVMRMFEKCQDVVLAWGAHAEPNEAFHIVELIERATARPRLWHLGRLKNGQPRHPLHTAYATPLQEWA